ncbi:hypothetical protein NQ314_017853 [Rhamnusium bicolor]|uniref:Farnesol dehydrogenase-like n=1 Tax=Rhamnusium bicolor TaxID=1586634 RepID=A0AAV8WSJ7_9CUCU|nr:hypothetical protein NQ314_017853 [Rhamnusium bicolor]
MVLSMDRWAGKVAVVTGASSGIGAAIAERLVEYGLKVAALARRLDRLESLAKKLSGKKGKLFPIKTDMTKEEDILNAFKYVKGHLSPIHILINNAGIMPTNSFISDGDTKLWENIFKLNVIGLSIATREAVKDMMANNVQGHIIHINSVVGHQVLDFPGLSVYPASKYAVTALAETLRIELNSLKLKIKITSISPGAVDTELQSEEFKETPYFKDLLKENKILKIEDIADAAIYVLSTPPHVLVNIFNYK